MSDYPQKHPYSIEPPQEMREGAHHLRAYYSSLIQAGFDDRQALVIIGQVLAAGIQGDK